MQYIIKVWFFGNNSVENHLYSVINGEMNHARRFNTTEFIRSSGSWLDKTDEKNFWFLNLELCKQLRITKLL